MTEQATKRKTTLRPLTNKVIAKRLEKKEKTASGIIIPDSAQKKEEILTVIAVGPGQMINDKIIPMPVKVGDTILMDKYSGQEVSLDDEEYVIVKSDDIIAIIEN